MTETTEPDPAPEADVMDLKSVESSLKLQGYYAYASTVTKAAAEITRLRAELVELRRPDLRTVMGFEAGEAHAAAEVDALRARVAELEGKPRCEDCGGRGWIDLPGGYDETPCRQCNAAVAEIVDQNYRLHKALFDDNLRELLKVELYGTTPTPDPRDTRIAVLETALREAANAAERLAFSWPAPNDHTPQVVALANAIRRALGEETGRG